jgi:hypothetical protein
MEELFNQITEITGDRIASAKIFLKLNDYVYRKENLVKEDLEPDEECKYYVLCDDLEFGAYVFDNFVGDDWSKIE